MDMKTSIAALVLVTMVACGSPSETQPGAGGGGSGASPGVITPMDPESPVSCPPTCGDDGDADYRPDKPKLVTPTPGMKDVHPVAWEKAKPLGPRTVLVSYWSGVEPCNVLDHVEVRYLADKVEITIHEGYNPADEDTACIEIALLKGTKVHLDEPLDGRTITDGAP